MHLKIEIVILDFPKDGFAAKFKAAKIMLTIRVIVRQMSWTHSSEVEDLTFSCRVGYVLS